ncbi:Floricaula/leafy-like protein 2 [Hibiscus syriacus]|uniref:Floricaula/leafy-like transcription factor n=1 Tax=Hibiscus syriacus TaxID=106335 RepID=A0A6A2ZQ26_HIBSY|nr:Floricaula/leafy-like protein 2 [Hibiscus syriacus]
MDPETIAIGSYFKWDPRGVLPPAPKRITMAAATAPQPHTAACMGRQRDVGGLEELFQAYGIRYYTAATIAELGFTVNTLLGMKEEELDEMMNCVSQIFRWELLVGERYGIKAAVRAERRRLEEEEYSRRGHLISGDTTIAIDALSHEGLSEEAVQQEREAAVSGGGGTWDAAVGGGKKKIRRRTGQKKVVEVDEEDELEGGDDDENGDIGGGCYERQREHPFIVTEPGVVARGKKNGLDYLFHLYEQCREFLIQVQNIAKERGEKCPTKDGEEWGLKTRDILVFPCPVVLRWRDPNPTAPPFSDPNLVVFVQVTNQVFRYAKKSGASYINKPKMRHYVHCYALHCLDEDASNALRRAFKERSENVGAWRQACYKPLVAIAAHQGWDVYAVFNAHPRLAIWYVPTKLRQLCHLERNNATASNSVSGIVNNSTTCLY